MNESNCCVAVQQKPTTICEYINEIAARTNFIGSNANAIHMLLFGSVANDIFEAPVDPKCVNDHLQTILERLIAAEEITRRIMEAMH